MGLRLAASMALVLVGLVPGRAAAEESPPFAPPVREVFIAVSDFVSFDPARAGEAQAAGALVATRLAQHSGARLVALSEVRGALALGNARALLGGGDEDAPPVAEVAGLHAAQFLVQGRLDAFARRYVLTAALLDARTGRAVGRFRVDAAGDSEVPSAADRLADLLGKALELPPPVTDAELITGHEMIGGPVAFLNVKLGQTIAGLQGFSLDAFTLRFDLAGEIVLKRWLHGYVEIGLLLGRAKSDTTQNEGTFSLFPAGTGLKFIILPDSQFQPYFSLGIGLGFLAAIAGSEKGVAFRMDAVAGVAWLPWERVGVNAELRADLDTHLLYGFSANFGVLFAF